MWDKARHLAARHLKPAFVNLKIVSSEDRQTSNRDISEEALEEPLPALLPESLETVAAERDQLRAELAEVQDRLLRGRADFENFRRRSERDRSDFLQFAGMEVVREVLPILDDFERAQKSESTDAGYRKGIDLIYQRFVDTLKRIGLEPIAVEPGTPFDPNLHQAVVRAETAEAPDNTVLEEFQRGYNFKGKLLRPAMVKVAVNPAA
jgi:molecular chaperone GrpE